MDAFFERISNYQFLNNLLPGTIFVIILNSFTSFIIENDNILILLFICYFFGFVISRIGSLVVEPILENMKFVRFKTHSEYISASLKDKKIDLLMEHNNLFRSFIAMLLLVGFVMIYDKLQTICPFLERNNMIIFLVLLIFLFLFSFRKQTIYISNRIEYYENKKEDFKNETGNI